MTENKTLLIIDDEPSILDALKQLFEIEGYEVHCYTNAAPALKKTLAPISGRGAVRH